MVSIDVKSSFEGSYILDNNKDFSRAILLAKTTEACEKKLENLFDKKRNPKTLWAKVLSLKADLIKIIEALEANIRKSKLNQLKFKSNINPEILSRLNMQEKQDIDAHTKVIDALISKLSTLITECFTENSKEYAAIKAEIERLKGRKLAFSAVATRPSQKAPVRVKPQSEYEAFRYVYKPPVQTQNNPFEPQLWWLFAIPLAPVILFN